MNTQATLPTAETLEKRVEAQRTRLFGAAAIVGLAAIAARDGDDPVTGDLPQNTACDIRVALEQVQALLDDIAGDLDEEVLFDPTLTALEATNDESLCQTPDAAS